MTDLAEAFASWERDTHCHTLTPQVRVLLNLAFLAGHRTALDEIETVLR